MQKNKSSNFIRNEIYFTISELTELRKIADEKEISAKKVCELAVATLLSESGYGSMLDRISESILLGSKKGKRAAPSLKSKVTVVKKVKGVKVITQSPNKELIGQTEVPIK